MFNSVVNNSLQIRTDEWSEEKSDELAKQGMLVYFKARDWNGNDSLYIEQRISNATGFGTASTRFVFKESLKNGCEGRICNQAAWSSHIFHLYMGMLPVDRKISYIRYQFGLIGEMAVKNFDKIKEKFEAKEELDDSEKRNLCILKNILSEVDNLSRDKITDEMVFSSKEKFEQLKNKKLSYLKKEFIPSLLDILEKSIQVKRPNTETLTSVNMYLSEDGIKRWKEAVDHKKPFVPFKKFEQLRPFMKKDQIERLDKILELREKAFSGNSF